MSDETKCGASAEFGGRGKYVCGLARNHDGGHVDAARDASWPRMDLSKLAEEIAPDFGARIRQEERERAARIVLRPEDYLGSLLSTPENIASAIRQDQPATATPPTQPEGERACCRPNALCSPDCGLECVAAPEQETPAPETTLKSHARLAMELVQARAERDAAKAYADKCTGDLGPMTRRIQALEAERDAALLRAGKAETTNENLESEIDRITAERDAALKARDEARSTIEIQEAVIADLRKERDSHREHAHRAAVERKEAEAESSALREERDRLVRESESSVIIHEALVGERDRLAERERHHQKAQQNMLARAQSAEAQVATLTAERDALAKFKAYVHQRLDEAGIPTHPDGPHSKEGCRIGDRLDLLIEGAKVAAEESRHFRAHVSALKGALEGARVAIEHGTHRPHEHNPDPAWRASRCEVFAPGILAIDAALSSLPSEPAPLNDPPTHRCKVCGALWWLGNVPPVGLSWSLRSPSCGPCCDNAAMGEQIEPLAPQPSEPEGRCATCKERYPARGETVCDVCWTCPVMEGCVRKERHAADSWHAAADVPAAPPPPAKAEAKEEVLSPEDEADAVMSWRTAAIRDRVLEEVLAGLEQRLADDDSESDGPDTEWGRGWDSGWEQCRESALEFISDLKSAPPSAPPQDAHEGRAALALVTACLELPDAEALQRLRANAHLFRFLATSTTSTEPRKEDAPELPPFRCGWPCPDEYGRSCMACSSARKEGE